MTTSPILLTGGTGRTGRRIAARLQHAHRDHDVRIASRTAPTPFDWNSPETWDANLDGAQSAYICYSPDLTFPGADESIAAFVDRARAHQLTRLVLLSGRGEVAAERCEQIVVGSGLDATVVRCAMFAQNFSETFLVSAVLRRRLRFPASETVEPFVDLDDVCDIITLALTEPGHEGHLYELTGPEALSFAQIAALLSEATGRDVSYESVTSQAFADDLTDDGLPREDAEALATLFAEVLDGRNGATTNVIEELLGRPASTFADYVQQTARTGVWSTQQPVAS